MFSSSNEPIVVDDWIRKIGRDLTTTGCTDAEKVHFAAHQLDGPAASWWENFTATYPVDTVTWDQFQQAFRTAHVSTGAMGRLNIMPLNVLKRRMEMEMEALGRGLTLSTRDR